MTYHPFHRVGFAEAVLLALIGVTGCEQSQPTRGGQGGTGVGLQDGLAGAGGSLGLGGAGDAPADGAADHRPLGEGGRTSYDASSGGAAGRGGAVAPGGAGGGSGGALGTGGNRPDGGQDALRDAGADLSIIADATASRSDGAADAPPATDGGAPSGNLVPAQGALLGMYFGNGTMSATETLIGRKVAVHLVYYAWDDDWTRGTTKSDLDGGRIPLVNWEPDGIAFDDIVSGKLDSTINARATGAKALGRPFFLDFAAESNGDEAWSGNNAALYVSAYRHIHDLFVAGGATNVVWAWCPNVTDTDGSNKTTMNYYPGDDYVDWTGVDGYNWGGRDWETFEQVFARIYPLLAAKGKPILIGEMSSSPDGGDKAAWIDAIVPTLKSSYPLIKGVVWFDVNKEEDWRIDSSADTLAAFKRMATDPYFNP